jgi:predicted glycosyltransferase
MLHEARAARARPLVCCSVRDILTSRAKPLDHDARAVQLLARYFDAVFVHSDPTFATLEDSLAPGIRLPVPVHYTGFVHRGAAQGSFRRRTSKASVIVSAGGGLVGEPLLQTALEAQSLLPPQSRRHLSLIAGPFLPDDAWRRLRRLAAATPLARMRRMVPHLGSELRGAAGSISPCGYNTAIDVLDSRVPALVVPSGGADEDEQLKRARRLEALGAVRVLPADDMTPPRLAVEMASLATFAPAVSGLDLRGAEQTVDIVDAMLDHGAPWSGAALPPVERTA